LIDEHRGFLVIMPDELMKLKQTMQGSCLCRRPYEGFMIGCDICDEWYHGACISVSAVQADKVDKYICLRCSISKVYEGCASSIAGSIKKWSDPGELKKSRSADRQRHQRKIRKEHRDLERLEPEMLKSQQELEMLKSTTGVIDCQPCQESDTAPMQDAPLVLEKPHHDRIADLNEKLEKTAQAIANAKKRLEKLDCISTHRKNIELEEDANKDSLRSFFAVVRLAILAPEQAVIAAKGKPRRDGTLSTTMESIVRFAEESTLSRFTDVSQVRSLFECICWCFRAQALFVSKPRFEDISSLVFESQNLKGLEEKPIRMLKSIVHRANQWQTRVAKALTPKKEETKPYDVGMLKDLLLSARDIPLKMAEELKLQFIIDDNGARYCMCGGPSDGSFMMCCDRCDLWHHGKCVEIASTRADGTRLWTCMKCSFSNTLDHDDFLTYSEDRRNSSQPRILESSDAESDRIAWPPFGLDGSEKALQLMGKPQTSSSLKGVVSELYHAIISEDLHAQDRISQSWFHSKAEPALDRSNSQVAPSANNNIHDQADSSCSEADMDSPVKGDTNKIECHETLSQLPVGLTSHAYGTLAGQQLPTQMLVGQSGGPAPFQLCMADEQQNSTQSMLGESTIAAKN